MVTCGLKNNKGLSEFEKKIGEAPTQGLSSIAAERARSPTKHYQLYMFDRITLMKESETKKFNFPTVSMALIF